MCNLWIPRITTAFHWKKFRCQLTGKGRCSWDVKYYSRQGEWNPQPLTCGMPCCSTPTYLNLYKPTEWGHVFVQGQVSSDCTNSVCSMRLPLDSQPTQRTGRSFGQEGLSVDTSDAPLLGPFRSFLATIWMDYVTHGAVFEDLFEITGRPECNTLGSDGHILLCPCDPIVPRELHWLPVGFLVQFKGLFLTYKILHGIRTGYLRNSSFLSICCNETESLHSGSHQLNAVICGTQEASVAAVSAFWTNIPPEIHTVPILMTYH